MSAKKKEVYRGKKACLYCGTKLSNDRSFCDHWCRKEYNENLQDEKNGAYHVPV